MSATRRTFMKLMGASALLPILPSALDASPSDGETPRRLLILCSPNGTVPGEFFPDASDGSSFSPGKVLKPLVEAGYKGDLTFFKGFDNVYGDDGHWSVGSLLTGRPTFEQADHKDRPVDGLPKGPSVDQVIGTELQARANTQLKALNLGVCATGYDADRPMASISYSGKKSPVLPENNPARVFDTLFGDNKHSAQKLARLRADRKSVLDLVRGNVDQFRQELGKRDRKRVDAHFQAVRELEESLTAGKASCRSIPDGFGGETIDWKAKSNTPELTKMHRTLITKTFECDLSRVATVMFSQENNGMAMTWLDGHSSSDIHHHWSHLRNPVHDDDASESKARQKLLDINQWYAGEVAKMVDMLDGIPDPVANDGSSVFDNTLVAWVNNLYDGGRHDTKNLPLVTIGDAGGAIDSGQVVDYNDGSHRGERDPGQRAEFEGRSHQDFLVTLCRAMGVNRTSFGNPKTCSGPVQEVLT